MGSHNGSNGNPLEPPLFWLDNTFNMMFFYHLYSGRGKFMPLPLKSKILETPGSLPTDDIKIFLL